MDQGLELSLWLGIAGLAICLAHILLWRTRRVLNRTVKDPPAPEAVRVPVAPARGVRLVPTAVKKSAGSVIAS